MYLRKTFKVLILIAFLALPLQACGDSSYENASNEAQSMDGGELTAVEALGLEEISAEAPSFKLKDTRGQEVSLEDFRGKYVLLNFWATWCPPCKAEMPTLEEVHHRFTGRGLEVIAINDYEKPKKAINFVEKGGYTFLVLIDESGKVSEAYKAMVLPMTYIIDPEGVVIARAVGYKDWANDASIEYLEGLIKK